jgi:hypothetical protein
MTQFENKKFSVGGYHPTLKGVECEACVFGKGNHTCSEEYIHYTLAEIHRNSLQASKLIQLNSALVRDDILRAYLDFFKANYNLFGERIEELMKEQE